MVTFKIFDWRKYGKLNGKSHFKFSGRAVRGSQSGVRGFLFAFFLLVG